MIFTKDPTPEPEEKFDFSSPEDVLIEVIADDDPHQRWDWKGFKIETCTVIKGGNGAASYEHAYGGFLDYTMEEIADCPKCEGWFVVEAVTAVYHRGDGWTTDDDMDFECTGIRPATDEERAMA